MILRLCSQQAGVDLTYRMGTVLQWQSGLYVCKALEEQQLAELVLILQYIRLEVKPGRVEPRSRLVKACLVPVLPAVWTGCLLAAANCTAA